MNTLHGELSSYLEQYDEDFIKRKMLIDHDCGIMNIDLIKLVEQRLGIVFPSLYLRFISKHNGAYLYNDSFSYVDAFGNKNQCSMRFIEFGSILGFVQSQKIDKTNCCDVCQALLIPFGSDGGEGMIFFDYTESACENNPKISMMFDSEALISVSNNFEEFVDHLYVDEMNIINHVNDIEKYSSAVLSNSYKDFIVNHCVKNFNKKFLFCCSLIVFLFPSSILWKISKWNEKRIEHFIPFAKDEHDNMLCFDCRNVHSLSIVFLKNYGTIIEKVANNFEEFINMLHGPEDIDSEGGPGGPKKFCL